jgi:hypothetical protein
MELKQITQESIPRALELAERYRLLNEPEQAASIYRDVLAVDSGNDGARIQLFLCVTDQFAHHHGPDMAAAEEILEAMTSEYDQAYYQGVACERWARARLDHGEHPSLVGDWLRRAMVCYETADGLRPETDQNAALRWNACARIMTRIPDLAKEREELPELGD